MANQLQIGFNTFDSHVRLHTTDCDGIIKKCGGLDFVVCHFDPNSDDIKTQCENAKNVAARLKELGLPFVANFEAQNFNDSIVSSDGYDWANHEDGTHRLDIPAEYIAALKEGGDLISLMYDEFEHTIINRNISVYHASRMKRDLPVFPLAYTDNMRVQGEALSKQVGEFVQTLKDRGAPAVAGEHVFPVLYHTFARNGMAVNFKSQKESYTNVQFAVAAGAALEYGVPLWTCVDLWHKNTYPGHSAEEMYFNLLFAFLTGVERAYVEASSGFVSNHNGEEHINEYGEAFSWFVSQFRGKDRSYTVRDYKPEIGIIRYDDTFWGQTHTPHIWRYQLFGNPNVKPNKKNKEWIKAFRLITHGETTRGGIAWDRIEPQSLLPHRSFASMNGAAVFDDRVTGDKLTSLKLCFLCGEYISEKTLKDVKELVHNNGLTVVTTKRFSPEGIRKTVHSNFREIPDGKGRWIVCENFEDPRLKARIAPFLGNKGEMTFKFGSETVRLQIARDGNTFLML